MILPFTYFVFFQYTVVARSYCLFALVIFAIGVFYKHRFEKPLTYNIHEVLRDDVCEIERSMKVHFLGKYFDWLLSSSDILKMPLGVSAKCFLELVQARD